jgi:nucleoside-diphosphate-sugar epimerase
MKILITGSNGMLGEELKKLIKKSNTIIDFNRSDDKNILSEKQLNHSMKKVDMVIHLAALLNGTNEEIYETNYIGTKNVFESAVKHKVKHFIFLSSTGVYGNTNEVINESTNKDPQTTYEKSKFDAEQYLLKNQEKINVKIIRSAMILGNNKYWRSMFCVLKKGFPLPCKGNNIFQIIYVKDLARAVNSVITKGKAGEVYLVSGKEKWTLKEFCKFAKKEMKKGSFVFSIPKTIAIFFGKIFKIKIISESNIRHICKNRNYDITKIEKLGYEQKYSLEEAIIKTIKEMKL